MEVPGKRSHLSISSDGSNEDDEDFYCDPCENEGERQPAKGFCIDCQEYLCSSCFTIHRRPAVWRHHVLLDKHAMPKTKTKEQLNYECTEPCVEHSPKIIEYYCQTHHQLGCPVCITGNHRKCNDVDYIPRIAEQYRDSSEINEIFESLESLQEETDKHTATANNDKLKVAVYEKSAKAQVLQLRDEFNSICDRLLEDIESVKSSDESKIKNSTAKYEEISKKIKTRTAAMEKKRSEMKVSQLFTEAKLSKLSVEELAKEVKLARESASIRHYEITFNVEELRDGLKLPFHDNEIENAITEFECHSPSEYQNKLARNSTMSKAEEGKRESSQPANAAGQSKKRNKRNVKASSMEGKVERGCSPDPHHSDVWSHLNTKGRKQYDREFLLRFRNCAYALRKPKHLPDIPNIILDKSIEESSNENPSDFKPRYAWTSTAAKRPPSKQGQGQQQYAKAKENKYTLSIIDPDSGKDVTADILKTTQSSTEVTRSSDSGSRTMLVGNAEETQGQSGESNAIAAQFAALVAAKLYHPPEQTPPPSQQQQFFQPRQQNIFAIPSLPFEIQYPHPGTRPSTIQMMTHVPAQPKMMAVQKIKSGVVSFLNPKKRIQSTQFSNGMPNSHLGPAQYPHQQCSSYAPGSGNKPLCKGFKTANVQTGRDGAADSQDSNTRCHTFAITKVGAKLNDLIVRNKEDTKAVIEWIDCNVNVSAKKQPQFIRALMTVICNSAIKGKKGKERIEPKEINARKDLMHRYFDHQDDRELQALFAVQAFVSKIGYPKGVLRGLFETLYDEDLIGEEAFFQWERSTDEPDGKEECLKQTVQFFTRLIETDIAFS